MLACWVVTRLHILRICFLTSLPMQVVLQLPTLQALVPGAGAVWEFAPGFTLSGNYVAYSGGNDSSIGIAADETGSVSAWQLMYAGEQLGGNVTAAAMYSYEQNYGLTIGTTAANALPINERNSFSIAGSWAPMDSGVIPSISTGYGYSDPSDTSKDIQTWYVGLEWSDVFVEGNSLGGAIGQAPYVVDNDDDEEKLHVGSFLLNSCLG